MYYEVFLPETREESNLFWDDRGDFNQENDLAYFKPQALSYAIPSLSLVLFQLALTG